MAISRGTRGTADSRLWQVECRNSIAFALGANAAIVARANDLSAYDLPDGRKLWSQPLPASPAPWGLCVNRDGRVIVALDDGRVVCIGSSPGALVNPSRTSG